jgi:hypothetical protein
MVRLGDRTISKSYNPADEIVNVPQSNLYNAAGVFQSVFASAFNCTERVRQDSIVYTTKRKSERSLPNWCRHIRNMEQYLGDSRTPYRITFVAPNPNPGWYTDYYAGHSHVAIAHSTALITAYGASQLNVAATPVYPGSAQDDIDLAIVDLKPDLTVLSLPNFLLELDDVGKLFQVWKKNVGTVRNIAGAHLNYSFGWVPTIGDIRNMTDAIQNVMDRIAAFEKSANQVRNSHRILSKTSLTKSGNFVYSTNHKCYWSGTKITTKTAGLVFRPQPFQVTRGYKLMLRAYLDALGFELNPRIIWDALPFTFILDWFFGIGSWLERHKYDTLELPITFLGSYVQVKEAVQVESRLVLGGQVPLSGQSPNVQPQPPKTTARIYYERVPVAPSESVLAGLGFRLPTRKQALLMASLTTVLSH